MLKAMFRAIARIVAGVCALVAAVGCIARMLPSELQSLPYVPQLVSVTPWLIIPAIVALILSLPTRRWIVAVVSVVCIAAQVMWQGPFFVNTTGSLSGEAQSAVSSSLNTSDQYARVMTFNVYRGDADPEQIVRTVRDEHVEVLALQETTDEFVEALTAAGIGQYLPYSRVSSADGVFGNGLWSATPLGDPSDDDVDSVSSFMPGGTVTIGDVAVRFVSVHTTAPVAGYWNTWRQALEELGRMRADTGTVYVFMGDFNATVDHTPFREFLGDRFRDAVMQAGEGIAFTWPTPVSGPFRFSGIDHIVVDQGITTGDCEVIEIDGSDHAALLATLELS